MHYKKIKQLLLLFGLLLPTTLFCAYSSNSTIGSNPVQIKQSHVLGNPKDYAIQASINGHTLTVVFTENLGNVTVEVSKVNGGETQVESTPTPNGVNFYIYETGSYIVTFTLSNGDVYYGEFDVTD